MEPSSKSGRPYWIPLKELVVLYIIHTITFSIKEVCRSRCFGLGTIKINDKHFTAAELTNPILSKVGF